MKNICTYAIVVFLLVHSSSSEGTQKPASADDKTEKEAVDKASSGESTIKPEDLCILLSSVTQETEFNA